MQADRKRHRLRVAIVSERRADYSRFKPILSLMRRDPFFDYRLFVTGISLLKLHGEDIRTIRQDGFRISGILPMYHEGAPDTGAEMTRSYARILEQLSDSFERVSPDLILTGFDIGANFAAAIVGAHMNIPVAHIQGGEVTGSIDESLRHATSKFAHIHFPATQIAAQRLRRMGEDPRFIFAVGCPSIDALIQAPRTSRMDTLAPFGLNLREPYVLVVQHPVTTEVKHSGSQIKDTLEAVASLKLQGIVLCPNNDAGSRAILRAVENSRMKYIQSLSPEQYANVLRHAACLVGNSSSGIHEAATFKIPVVNIGTRQQGRERPKNVIDVGYSSKEIMKGLEQALYNSSFRRLVSKVKNPYGDGRSAPRIIKILKHLDLSNIPIQKQFVD
ncbi:UDP-N-acetylglucosamine 2-epimerase (hydrolyzing) [Candidatus Uhrbacteria bacterium]|nr:UDP-N-acetylglucosamine 2-epimerase (hydrolyzing) [Candidatus Uhrbacteria bacterium]